MMRRGSAANEEIISRANYLLEGAFFTDTLLQSYRAFHLIMQLILIGIGIGLAVAILAFDDPIRSGFTSGILFGFGYFSLRISDRMRDIIVRRRSDVAYWQRKLILTENELPEAQRYFTEFRIAQWAGKRGEADDLRAAFLQSRLIVENDLPALLEPASAESDSSLESQLYQVSRSFWALLCGASVLYVFYLLLTVIL